MSHIVFESVNMGLFLKYILEGGYEVDIDFSKEILMNHNGKDIDFSFSEFQARRENAAKEKNNGRIRCPMESKGKLLQKGGLFSSDQWIVVHIVLTNIGLFVFDAEKLASEAPQFVGIHELSIKKSSEKVATLSYILEVYAMGKLRWTISCTTGQSCQIWETKITEMIKEYSMMQGKILMPELF